MHLLTQDKLTLLKLNFEINSSMHVYSILMLLYTLDCLLLCFCVLNCILEMPKRLIQSDLHGLEKESLTKNNIRSDLPVLHTQKHHVNAMASPDLQSCNDNNENINISQGKQPVHISYGQQPFGQRLVSTVNE